MSNGDENRRSFRVNESAYLKYDLLTDEEFELGLAHRKISRGENDDLRARLVEIDARLSETMYRMTGESDTVGKCITLLNDKINLLFDALPGVQQTKADLAQQQLLQCDVGADGIVFPSKQQIEVGAKLHLRMLLASDKRMVETFCRVVRHAEVPPGNDPDTYTVGIAVEFHGMMPSEREMLIQHMFNKESETLRMRRLQLDKVAE